MYSGSQGYRCFDQSLIHGNSIVAIGSASHGAYVGGNSSLRSIGTAGLIDGSSGYGIYAIEGSQVRFTGTISNSASTAIRALGAQVKINAPQTLLSNSGSAYCLYADSHGFIDARNITVDATGGQQIYAERFSSIDVGGIVGTPTYNPPLNTAANRNSYIAT